MPSNRRLIIGWGSDTSLESGRPEGDPKLILYFFPQALLAGFSFRTGEYKAFAVRKIAAKPEKAPILHKILPGSLLGNLLGNVPGPFFVKKM